MLTDDILTNQETKIVGVEIFKEPVPAKPPTENRVGTIQGCGGHYQCRQIEVTLPLSRTLQ